MNPSTQPLRTNVYIDGFNLFYGLLKGSEYKWLDIAALLSKYLDSDKNQINSIKYFTAKVKQRLSDPSQQIRQMTYLRALQTISNLEIIYGHFLSHTSECRWLMDKAQWK